MKTHFILLELRNDNFNDKLQRFVVNNSRYIDSKRCCKQKMIWLCEDKPHITLLGNVDNVSNNESFRKIKYSKDSNFDEFKKKSAKGLIFPELIVDTFKDEQGIILKINCKNCNLYNDIVYLHNLLSEELPFEVKHKEYSPHITLTYLNHDTSDFDVSRMCKELSNLLPRYFQIKSIILSDEDRNIDRIELLPKFAGF